MKTLYGIHSTQDMVFSAAIAALYTALCLALAPISFGAIQFRVAEALTILPVFSPVGVWGVTMGCLLSNLVGLFTGANILGILDIFFGTAATLIAALLSRAFRRVQLFNLPVLSALPPVLTNAIIIGAELAWLLAPGDGFAAAFALNALQVGAGQLIACVGLGVPLYALMERTDAAKRCFGKRYSR